MSRIWGGVDGWGYCLNAAGAFTGQWLAFVFSSRATPRGAIMAAANTVAAANPKSALTLRVDNGIQYTSRECRSSAAATGIALEYVYVSTPEQNRHIESFHKGLKKERVWPREFAGIHEAKIC